MAGNEPEPQACQTTVYGYDTRDEDWYPRTFNAWSSHTKALTSHLAAQFQDDYSREQGSCGRRCNTYYKKRDKRRLRDKTYRDVNAASFFITLVNNIGRDKKAFVAEVTADAPVWNQSVMSFKHKKFNKISDSTFQRYKRQGKINPHSEPARSRRRMFEVKTEVEYIIEVPPHEKAPQPKLRKRTLHYILEVDGRGKIVGGTHVGRSIDNHFDFLWSKGALDPSSNPQARKFYGDEMAELLEDAGATRE